MRPMRYAPDLERLPLAEYRELLRVQNLLPSRRILLDGLEEKFKRMQALGVHTAADLLGALSSPAKMEAFAATSGIPAAYLTILRRETGALQPKAVPLSDFPGVDPALIADLATRGIHHTKAYFEQPDDPGGDLYALCDLSRINGVGPGAARMFLDAGYRSAADIAAADAEGMLRRIEADNAAHRYYRGTLGLKDMQFCIRLAGLLHRLCR